jgi:hypothetical protein
MATIHFHATAHATPEQFAEALTDFGPCHANVFATSDDGYRKVHDRGHSEADVTEGSHWVWERLHYDWSNPEHIVLDTTDSNVWGGRSGYTYTLTRQPFGVTDIDVVIRREGKNRNGRLRAAFLATIGAGALIAGFENTVRAIDARYDPAPAAQVC